MIHKLTYRRHNHDNIHVRGYKEEGTTTTPFDMVVLNNLDRYQLALDAIERIPRLARPGRGRNGALLDDDRAPQALRRRAWRRPAGGARLALGADELVLTLNSGSSSLKFGLYRVGTGDLEALIAGERRTAAERA